MKQICVIKRLKNLKISTPSSLSIQSTYFVEQRATWAKIVASGTGSASTSVPLVVD